MPPEYSQANKNIVSDVLHFVLFVCILMRLSAGFNQMVFDPIIYIEIALVFSFILAQKVYTERFTNILSTVSLSLVVSAMLGWVVFL